MSRTLLHLGQEDFAGIAEEILEAGKKILFRATGSSMSPFIKDGDGVLIVPGYHTVCTGDVVLVRTDNKKLLLHRVSRKKKNGVLTRGDAASTDDGLIPYNNILGKVVAVSRGYNFHLRNPFKFLIGRRILYSEKLLQFPFIVHIGKVVASVRG